MKKTMPVLALCCALLGGSLPVSAKTYTASQRVYTATDLSGFTAALQKDYYVQEGSYEEIDCLKLASEGKLTSCFGNNQGSSYQVGFLPPAPEQSAAKGVAKLNWVDEVPTGYDDPNVENYPANPYFAPVGWSYKLREDEAVVLMYDLPSDCKYFSIGAYLMLSETEAGQDLSSDKYAISMQGAPEVGNYHVEFASLGDQRNNFNIASSTTPYGKEGSPYGAKAVVVMGGDKKTNQEMVDALTASGIHPAMINLLELPSQTLNLGLEKGGDTFCLLARVSQPSDDGAYATYIETLPETSAIYRITPKVKDAVEEIPALAVKPRGTGEHEAVKLGYATKDLASIRQSILDKYTGEGYTYTELTPHISVPDGITSIFNTFNGKGDNRDTSYLSTDYFTFESEDDFVVLYGVNHTATEKAIYSNAVLYGVDKLNGVTSVYDALFPGSAQAYLDEGYHNSDHYYVYKLDRNGTEPYSAKVPYSTGNPQGKYYGLDDGQKMLIAFRAYIEKATGIGPDYNEIVYDRAIVFHKQVAE